MAKETLAHPAEGHSSFTTSLDPKQPPLTRTAPEGAPWCMLEDSCVHLRVSSALSFILAIDTCKEKLVSMGVFILLQMLTLVEVQNSFNLFKLTVMNTDFVYVICKEMRAVIHFIKRGAFPP